MESDVVSSRELTNTLKPVGIGPLMRSSLMLSGEVRSCLLLAHSVVGFLGGLGGSHLLVSLAAQFSWTIPSFDEERRPNMAGSGLVCYMPSCMEMLRALMVLGCQFNDSVWGSKLWNV